MIQLVKKQNVGEVLEEMHTQAIFHKSSSSDGFDHQSLMQTSGHRMIKHALTRMLSACVGPIHSTGLLESIQTLDSRWSKLESLKIIKKRNLESDEQRS